MMTRAIVTAQQYVDRLTSVTSPVFRCMRLRNSNHMHALFFVGRETLWAQHNSLAIMHEQTKNREKFWDSKTTLFMINYRTYFDIMKKRL